MIGEKFNINNKDWVKQIGAFVVFSDTKLGEISLYGKLVYSDDTTAIIKNSDVVIVSRTGHFSQRALEVYEKLKDKIEFEEDNEDFDHYKPFKERTEDEYEEEGWDKEEPEEEEENPSDFILVDIDEDEDEEVIIE